MIKVNNYNVIKSILNSLQIKTLLSIIIIFNFIFVLVQSADFYAFDLFCHLNSMGSYNCFVALFMLYACNISLNIFNSYNNILIRYKDKKTYYKELVKCVLIVNFIICIVNFLVLLTNIFFFSDGVIILNNYANGVSSLVYFIWTFVKKIILYVIMSFLFLIIIKLLKKPYNIIASVFSCVILFLMPYNDRLVSSISKMFLFPFDYFVYHRYTSFMLEICIFSAYFSVIMLILYILYLYLRKTNISLEN